LGVERLTVADEGLLEGHSAAMLDGPLKAAASVWHQRRAQRVRCMPGLGAEREGVKLGDEAWNEGTGGMRDRVAPCSGRRRMA